MARLYSPVTQDRMSDPRYLKALECRYHQMSEANPYIHLYTWTCTDSDAMVDVEEGYHLVSLVYVMIATEAFEYHLWVGPQMRGSEMKHHPSCQRIPIA